MLPFAHALAAETFSYLKKRPERTLLFFLTLGFLGIAPDFDFVIAHTMHWTTFHRTWTHGIFAWVIGGIITLYFFKQFWPGFLAVMSHAILDIIDGGNVAILGPWAKVSLSNGFYQWSYGLFGGNWPAVYNAVFKDAQLWMSTVTGTAILITFIIIEWRNEHAKNN